MVSAHDVSEHTSCAMSLGSDVAFQTEQAKKDPNEDALLVVEERDLTVLCVADAHFGKSSAEDLILRIEDALRHIPRNPDELNELLTALSRAKRPPRRERRPSETSLLIAIHNRMFQQCFGASYGDSTFVHARPGGTPVRKNERKQWFVSPSSPKTLRPRGAATFEFSTKPGDLLLAFTDGIDECCYREPDRSITEFVLGATLNAAGHAPRPVVDALTKLALGGVNGNPGGQDNIALAVVRT